jgi:flagellar hook protein FlgE
VAEYHQQPARCRHQRRRLLRRPGHHDQYALLHRSGQFKVDASGFLVTTGGQRVLGYPTSAGATPTGTPTFALKVPTGSKDATVTTKIHAAFNLNADSSIKTDAIDGPFDPPSPGTYTLQRA